MNTPIADLFARLGFDGVASRVAENYIPEPNTGCWLWAGRWAESKPRDIRPRINLLDHEFMAYRLMYWVFRGAFDESKLICHTCDVSVCVNPDHLYVGDYTTNIRDCSRRGRLWIQTRPREAKIACRKGGKALSIIRDADLPHISAMQDAGMPYHRIAQMFGVAESTVSTRVSRYRRAALAATGSKLSEKRWKSCARWPDGTVSEPDSTTTDTHDTSEQAYAVCQLLKREGFVGQGGVFPLAVWVEPATGAKEVGS